MNLERIIAVSIMTMSILSCDRESEPTANERSLHAADQTQAAYVAALDAMKQSGVLVPDAAYRIDAAKANEDELAARSQSGSRGAFQSTHDEGITILPVEQAGLKLDDSQPAPSPTSAATSIPSAPNPIPTVTPTTTPPPQPQPTASACPNASQTCATACATATASAVAFAFAHASVTTCAWAQAWACAFTVNPFVKVCTWAQSQACASAFATAFGFGFATDTKTVCNQQCSGAPAAN